ncbi:MAG: permease-like cell division protein FtsX [Acidimicrobiales bacterium]
MRDLRTILERRAERGRARGAETVLADARRAATSAPSRKPLLAAAAIVAVLAVGAGIAIVRQGDDEVPAARSAAEDGFCALLADQPGLQLQRPRARGDLILFVEHRAGATEIAALRQRLADDPRVAGFDYTDQQAAYEEFLDLFRDKPKMVDSVSPEILPSSFELRLEDPATVDRVLSDYEGLPDVKEAVTFNDRYRAALFDLIVNTSRAVSRPADPASEPESHPDAVETVRYLFPDDPVGSWTQRLDGLRRMTPPGLRDDLGVLATTTAQYLADDEPASDIGPDLDETLDRFVVGVQRTCGLRPDPKTTVPDFTVTTVGVPDPRPTPESRPTVPQ